MVADGTAWKVTKWGVVYSDQGRSYLNVMILWKHDIPFPKITICFHIKMFLQTIQVCSVPSQWLAISLSQLSWLSYFQPMWEALLEVVTYFCVETEHGKGITSPDPTRLFWFPFPLSWEQHDDWMEEKARESLMMERKRQATLSLLEIEIGQASLARMFQVRAEKWRPWTKEKKPKLGREAPGSSLFGERWVHRRTSLCLASNFWCAIFVSLTMSTKDSDIQLTSQPSKDRGPKN